ncbi:hypothetical protein HZC09_06035 [Candidatus Micrarchaeota archaeon]|nr:hypothetical protein [Candidatus Micrarchaeota archaeon]
MGRGRERLVKCEKCGRQIRRDKAVFIEKPVFNNPLDRSEVADEYYTKVMTREFAYCPSCGKHLRIYEKKKEQQERQRERQRFSFSGGRRPKPQRYREPQPSQEKPKAAVVEAPKEQAPSEGEYGETPAV